MGMTSASTFDNIKNKQCFYSFNLCLTMNKTFEVLMENDVIRYYDDNQFYHINTSYEFNSSTLYHSTFDKPLQDIFTLTLPNVINLNNVKTIDNFIDKCKLLMIMS